MEPPGGQDSTQAGAHRNGAEAFEAREGLLRAALGETLLDAVHKARILMVGAGGTVCMAVVLVANTVLTMRCTWKR